MDYVGGTKPEDLDRVGVKYDEGKPAMELLSSSFIEGVARVLSFGAKKYSAHNWRKGIHQSRLIGAALRHLFAYLRGEDNDPETGLSHLLHAGCCIMFAFELKDTHPELDDRYKGRFHTRTTTTVQKTSGDPRMTIPSGTIDADKLGEHLDKIDSGFKGGPEKDYR